MDYFNYVNGAYSAENVPISKIAEQYGTPTYIYSRATIERHWHAFNNALGQHKHKICYAVKANSNLAVLNILARLGSGFDIVSGGELQRVLAAGGDPGKVVFSGVGKTGAEIELALSHQIYCFNVESFQELQLIEKISAKQQCVAPVAVRVNPNVDAKTHPYIATGLKENKFGVSTAEAMELFQYAHKSPHLALKGVDCHIGSQLTQIEPFLDALDQLIILIEHLEQQDIHIEHIDLGGGLGVRYDQETPPEPAEQASALLNRLEPKQYEIILEPGRAIMANAGILLTQVQFIKETDSKNFAIVDAAMNDLIRPSLYQAWQDILPVTPNREGELKLFDIVGPVCESGDFLAKDRSINLLAGDLLVIRSAGAYGFVMSSNYNTRPRVAEIMVDGDQTYCVRERETVSELFAKESILPE